MKKFIYSIVTLLILILINIISYKIFNLEFIELSFCVGLTSSVLVGFFSSEGGLISDMTDISIKFLLDSKSRNSSHFTKFHINTPIIICILYTLVSAILSVIIYWEYF